MGSKCHRCRQVGLSRPCLSLQVVQLSALSIFLHALLELLRPRAWRNIRNCLVDCMNVPGLSQDHLLAASPHSVALPVFRESRNPDCPNFHEKVLCSVEFDRGPAICA